MPAPRPSRPCLYIFLALLPALPGACLHLLATAQEPPSIPVEDDGADEELPVPSGPTKVVRTDVGSLQTRRADGALIVLRGHLTKQLQADKYLFSDGTGVIPVRIATYLFPPTPVTPETPLELRGQLNRQFLENPEFEVGSMVVLGQQVDALSEAKNFTINELLNKPIDGLPVTVSGEIVFFLDESCFVFRDRTGILKVEAEGLETELLDFIAGSQVHIVGRTMIRTFRTRGELRTEVKAYRIEGIGPATAAR
ncbi:MAG: NirD/YgiW/YdeI family stress tolerance protein [Opitutales bacterium]